MKHAGLLIVLCLTVLQACDRMHEGATLSRPSDKAFIEWLDGNVIYYQDSWLGRGWRIDASEISDFKVTRVTENPTDNSLTATVKFRVTDSGEGVEVSEAMIRYVPVLTESDENQLRYIDFVVVTYERIGK